MCPPFKMPPLNLHRFSLGARIHNTFALPDQQHIDIPGVQRYYFLKDVIEEKDIAAEHTQ